MDLMQGIEELIDTSIKEDIGSGDITTEACVPEAAVTSGRFFLKQAGVVAGLKLLDILYKKIDPSIEITTFVEEGTFHRAGTIVAKVSGPARGILTGERIALNLIQHASGVATITNEYVRKIRGLPCQILDTRKTLPGLRALEKYAVQVVGGETHRWGLYDRFIIKTNHLYFMATEDSSTITEAVKRVKEHRPSTLIEIEITNLDQLDEALQTEAVAIMLSRMPPDMIRKCVKKTRKTNKKIYLESLGTITLDTIRAYAETGVDGISISALTHSIQAIDIGMRLTSYKK